MRQREKTNAFEHSGERAGKGLRKWATSDRVLRLVRLDAHRGPKGMAVRSQPNQRIPRAKRGMKTVQPSGLMGSVAGTSEHLSGAGVGGRWMMASIYQLGRGGAQ